MKLYRRKKDGKLYVIYLCSPMRYTGSWLEAHPYRHNSRVIRNVNEVHEDGNRYPCPKQFTLVAER